MSKAKKILMNHIAFLWDLMRTNRRPPVSYQAGWVELWDPEYVNLGAINRESTPGSRYIKLEGSNVYILVQSIPVIITKRRPLWFNPLVDEPRERVLSRIPCVCKEEDEDDFFEFDDIKAEEDSFEYDDVKLEDEYFEYDGVKFEDGYFEYDGVKYENESFEYDGVKYENESFEYDGVKAEDDSFEYDDSDDDYFVPCKKPKLEKYPFNQKPYVEQYPLANAKSRGWRYYLSQYTQAQVGSIKTEAVGEACPMEKMEDKEFDGLQVVTYSNEPPPPGDDDYVPYRVYSSEQVYPQIKAIIKG